MATGSIDPKDPLASCNIPQIIEDKWLDYDAKAVHYKRGSLLGKVITTLTYLTQVVSLNHD